MFQYAAALRLASKRSTSVGLHLWLEGTQRRYGLRAFRISGKQVSRQHVRKLVGNRLHERVHRRVRAGLGIAPRDVELQEKSPFQFDPEALTAPDGVYMYGYWQSERYFADAEQVIRREFQLAQEPRQELRPLLSQIERENAVSLHIRRGDYVAASEADPLHYPCDLSYYRAAVEYIASKVANPCFFLFSDDPEWVRENLKLDQPMILVSRNGQTEDFEEMHLMSRSKHHIIANSTFSWWGAWLNADPDKIVVAPRQWYRKEAGLEVPDKTPDTWVRL